VAPISDVREISNLAYGFIASKVLFAALNARLFDMLAGGPRRLSELQRETGIEGNRLETLLTACVSLGLIEDGVDGFANASACQQYLVSTSPLYFGDYFRFQIDRQLYPLLLNLDKALRAQAPASIYDVMENPEEADYFTRAQHVGSLGPAAVIQKLIDLTGATRLLDVAGGSGAFSITLCRRFPPLRATILDLPNVTARTGIDLDCVRTDRADLLDRIHPDRSHPGRLWRMGRPEIRQVPRHLGAGRTRRAAQLRHPGICEHPRCAEGSGVDRV